jgi:hypothetical protein
MARIDPDADVKAGQPMTLCVNLDEAYFFDPGTGLAIPFARNVLRRFHPILTVLEGLGTAT